MRARSVWLLGLYRTTRIAATWCCSNNHDSSEQYLLDAGRADLLKGRASAA